MPNVWSGLMSATVNFADGKVATFPTAISVLTTDDGLLRVRDALSKDVGFVNQALLAWVVVDDVVDNPQPTQTGPSATEQTPPAPPAAEAPPVPPAQAPADPGQTDPASSVASSTDTASQPIASDAPASGETATLTGQAEGQVTPPSPADQAPPTA